MNQFKSAVAGIAGAVVLTVIHRLVTGVPAGSPRLDFPGRKGLSKIISKCSSGISEAVHDVAEGADLAANGIYYGLVGLFGKHSILAGAALGAAAGVGSVVIPPQVGLDTGLPDQTPAATQAMCVAIYMASGLAAGAVFKALHRYDRSS